MQNNYFNITHLNYIKLEATSRIIFGKLRGMLTWINKCMLVDNL